MHYLDVVKALRERAKVLVTGPQRAGTTIMTKMLAQDLGLPCMLEEAFGTTDVWRFFALVRAETHFVLQAPSMAAFCHHLKGVTVVFMMRDIVDIIQSQRKIGWAESDAEEERMRYFYEPKVPPASLKYHFWATHQKARLGDDGFELDYETASCHPLWLPKEQRVHFHSRQTTLEG